jgi:hypothetical protein
LICGVEYQEVSVALKQFDLTLVHPKQTPSKMMAETKSRERTNVISLCPLDSEITLRVGSFCVAVFKNVSTSRSSGGLGIEGVIFNLEMNLFESYYRRMNEL